jgi:hypothetical protein
MTNSTTKYEAARLDNSTYNILIATQKTMYSILTYIRSELGIKTRQQHSVTSMVSIYIPQEPFKIILF